MRVYLGVEFEEGVLLDGGELLVMIVGFEENIFFNIYIGCLMDCFS